MKETRLPQNGKEGLLYGSIICLSYCNAYAKYRNCIWWIN